MLQGGNLLRSVKPDVLNLHNEPISDVIFGPSHDERPSVVGRPASFPKATDKHSPHRQALREKGKHAMLCSDMNVETCTIQGSPLLTSSYCPLVAAG